jgi:hypothetical protein
MRPWVLASFSSVPVFTAGCGRVVEGALDEPGEQGLAAALGIRL